jgi:2-keto-4-pentenoate hydratase/2-oxohepta-3-ene-1,7-dioic acid hydratase in catechol pathway
MILASQLQLLGKLADPVGTDAFCPFGPAFISPARLPDPSNLSIEVVVNGQQKEVKVRPTTLTDVQK